LAQVEQEILYPIRNNLPLYCEYRERSFLSSYSRISVSSICKSFIFNILKFLVQLKSFET
jgi:hypothetical protein